MKRVVLLAASALLLASATWAQQSEPLQLRTVDGFAEAFNEDHGVPRMVLLLSPT